MLRDSNRISVIFCGYIFSVNSVGCYYIVGLFNVFKVCKGSYLRIMSTILHKGDMNIHVLIGLSLCLIKNHSFSWTEN